MEMFVRYMDRRDSMRSTLTPDVVNEETLRDDLKYYFMSPCEKYRSRRNLPWKLCVQILKIIMITTQLILFGLNNQLVVSYKEENRMALKNLFLKDYSGVDEDDYSIAVYTQQGVYDALFHVLQQYSQLGNLSVGPISYAEDGDGRLLPLVVCKRQFKRNSFFRLVDVEITFQLRGINLQSVRARELPDCYAFLVTITLDNQSHSGKVKVFMDIDSMTTQKNTHYLLVFDVFVILICLVSAVLCTRSIVLAVRLLQRFTRFFREKYNRKLCNEDQSVFLNGWYLLIIISDLLAIVGSILKMEIQAKSLTSYDVCSIFLGTATLMVWFGVIRYLGYFDKYNVLILTMTAALPKVLRFCCCAGMMYLGFTFCGWIVLGPYHEKFESLSRVAECLFSLLNGDDMFLTFAQLKDKNAVVWFFSHAYDTIKNYQKNGFPLTDLHKFLRNQNDFDNVGDGVQAVVDHTNFCCSQRLAGKMNKCYYDREMQFFYNNSKQVNTVMASTQLIMVQVVGSFFCCFILASNAMVITAVVTNRRFHYPFYYLLANLAASDFLAGIAYVYLMFHTGETSRKLTVNGYFIRQGLLDTSLSASLANLLVIALERYISVLNWKVHSNLTKRRVTLLIVLVWAFSVFMGAVPRMGWHCICNLEDCSQLAPIFSRSYLVFWSVSNLAVFLVMVCIYSRIYVYVKRKTALLSPHTSGSINRKRTPIKLIKTVMAVLGAFVICWTPGLVVLLLDGLNCKQCRVMLFKQWLLLLAVLNSVMNPCIYSYKDEEMWATLKNLIRCVGNGTRRQRSSKANARPISQDTGISPPPSGEEEHDILKT
ncbi:hypothetical protein NHX12_033616 [Muraenolepis orangiensis]|uniref:G-protein coupled receptors family 1 profile domain-containing protein n=1 Tax=Muraenolepis orangiensis TaxID=630683 RepID=A0A9Q0E6C0_9TELE|nr:hypothetical protein NHX12_033616 [Muraenolepis orangiensis]